jgi:hypothetical protein
MEPDSQNAMPPPLQHYALRNFPTVGKWIHSAPSIEAQAHHEAGHVLAALAWGAGIHSVTIVVDEEDPGLSGITTKSWGGSGNPATQGLMLRTGAPDFKDFAFGSLLGHVRYCLAGHAADFNFTGERPPLRISNLFDDDIEAAVQYIVAAFPGEGNTHHERIHRILTREYRRVKRWLREHQGHVDAIARALIRKKTLDGPAVTHALRKLGAMRQPGYRDRY